jgi:hypothetical protein
MRASRLQKHGWESACLTLLRSGQRGGQVRPEPAGLGICRTSMTMGWGTSYVECLSFLAVLGFELRASGLGKHK